MKRGIFVSTKIEDNGVLIAESKSINIQAYAKLLRPRQWIKNIFVFFGLIFSEGNIDIYQIIKSFIAFVLFCLISSSVYIYNDLIDIEADKVHPRKRFRPLAAGLISKRQAIMILVLIASFTLSFSFYFNFNFACIVMSYFLLNILYALKLKKIVIIDIMVIALGFVFRAISGFLVIENVINMYSLLCTFFLTLFLGLNKRKQELYNLNKKAKEHREILGEYSIEKINQMIPIVASCAILSYSFYTIQDSKSLWMMLTIPSVIYGMLRYECLAYSTNVGETPELILIKDKPFVLNILVLVSIVLVINII